MMHGYAKDLANILKVVCFTRFNLPGRSMVQQAFVGTLEARLLKKMLTLLLIFKGL
jgi:hypothetical protein